MPEVGEEPPRAPNLIRSPQPSTAGKPQRPTEGRSNPRSVVRGGQGTQPGAFLDGLLQIPETSAGLQWLEQSDPGSGGSFSDGSAGMSFQSGRTGTKFMSEK